MKIGLIVRYSGSIGEELRKARQLDFDCCQIASSMPELYTPENADTIRNALAENGIAVSTFWCGWSGPRAWNFTEGPVTLGIVPEAYRAQRTAELCRGAEFAARMGVNQMATHAGFLPEDPNHPQYEAIIGALRTVALRARENGVAFLFETGQETPTTLCRVMEDIGTDNLGVNYDPANLLMYGKANPMDALPLLGPHIRDVHAKDGFYPTSCRALGQEARLGDGMVDFSVLIGYLKDRGYNGAVTIEREITGDQQIEDIRHAKALLKKWIEQ